MTSDQGSFHWLHAPRHRCEVSGRHTTRFPDSSPDGVEDADADGSECREQGRRDGNHDQDRSIGVMLNKGPFIPDAMRFLDGLLTRMEVRRERRTPMLRQLSSSLPWGQPERR
jgi:hypothetical protein